MRNLKKIGFMAVMALATVACVDNDPEIYTFPDADVNFTYGVSGDEYLVDFYVVSPIQFTNVSEKSGTVTWNFGDGETSNEANPVHKYTKAGEYNVTLKIDATDGKTYSCTYPILIYDIVPKLTATSIDSIIEINSSEVEFALALPNPQDLKVKYVWTFPEGTTNEAGQEIKTFEGIGQKVGEEFVVEYPGKLKFKHIGSQRIDIQTWFDLDGENRQLEDTYLNVQVGCNYDAPTLYYAQQDGNVKALKLIDETKVPAGTKVFPYDMGVSSGSMPFNLCYGEYDGQQFIYIVDCGKQYYYINDTEDNLGDGKITAMGVDGSNVNVVVSNEGKAAFMDPYYGFVFNGELYYSDRNNGVSKIALNVRGQAETQDASDASFRGSYVFENDLIPYYNRGIAYGAISCGHYKDAKGMWYWGKNYSGEGIYRFKDTDIYTTAKDAEAAARPYAIMFGGIKIKSFTIDEKRNTIYVWRIEPASSGLYAYDIPAEQETGSMSKFTASVKMAAQPVNSTDSEQVHTTQLALDKETGRVYFAFRADSGDDSGIGTGIVCFDPETKKCTRYGETSDAGYGIVINPTLSKLF